jgi:nucleoside 2-deoxyribosyltransferase
VAAGQAGAELLDGSRTNRGAIPPKRAAAAIIHLLEQLVAPKVFYVRLLNKDLPEYEAVENFFRNVVDPTITEFGFEAKEMGIGPNEYAWINQAIFDILHHSDVALVDLTGVRPNCLMELGYALGNMQRVIVTAQKGTVLPFDSSCLETHPWNANDSLEKRLQQFKEHWKRNINMPPLVRPRGLK